MHTVEWFFNDKVVKSMPNQDSGVHAVEDRVMAMALMDKLIVTGTRYYDYVRIIVRNEQSEKISEFYRGPAS